jgi:hypothetical protein
MWDVAHPTPGDRPRIGAETEGEVRMGGRVDGKSVVITRAGSGVATAASSGCVTR